MAPRIDIRANIAETGATQINNVNVSTSYNTDDIDRSCLRALRCPDPLAVKNRLKENKGKLLRESFDWIFHDPQYVRWQEGKDVCLLWIKGGAGKGKTMMSIGLIEELSLRCKDATVVTYFFCQNADYELNTMEAIIKGLILQLVRQQEPLKQPLRDRWDTVKERFNEDVSSWRGLWNIFMEMLDCCRCPRVYVIVDALDECQDDGMPDLLKLIVRTGLSRPSQIKWLLTSRPLDSAERELLAGSDQVRVDLELNTEHISQGVKNYISYKVAELDRYCHYGSALRQDIKQALSRKAEDTYLWVSLVCKRLENERRDEALTTLQDLPPGLIPFYNRILTQLCNGEPSVVKGCTRLLKVMMVTYRPLNVREVSSVTGVPDDPQYIERLIDRSASFVKIRGIDIEFVHQSARDYLAGTNGQSLLDDHDQYGHGEIAMSCLSHLSRWLKVNLLDLPRPDSTRGTIKERKNELLASLDYAATFWFRHLDIAKDRTIIQAALAEHGKVETFFHARFLEWLECLSLLDKLPRAVEALKTLADVSADIYSLSLFIQDAMHFLQRHYETVSTWPLQVYSSAMVFSPATSVVRRENLDKIPHWLTNIPTVEEERAFLIQTLVGHSRLVRAVVFSPDGRRIASGSGDRTVKVWNAATGRVQKTLAGHSDGVSAVAFSPDSRRIASGSRDRTVKVWNITTGEVDKTLAGHSGGVSAVAFSPDGRRIASGSWDRTVKVWNATTGEVDGTLTGHSHAVSAVAFSPDGWRIASGSFNDTIKLWNATTGEVEKTLAEHSGGAAVAFSPDGQRIASGSWDWTTKVWNVTTGEVDKTLVRHSLTLSDVVFSPDGRRIASRSWDWTIKVWNVTTGEVEKTLAGHSDEASDVVFSPNSQRIASGSRDRTVKVWNVTTGEVDKILVGHLGVVSTVVFSPDGRRIASGSFDNTIKLWNTTTGEVEKTLAGHSGGVIAVVFSPDGQRIASGSRDRTAKVWNVTTGEVEKTLAGHSDEVIAVVFSPDGRRIASGSRDTIKLWDVVSLLKTSRWLGSTIGRRLRFRTFREIETSGRVSKLRFSADGTYLITDVDLFKIETVAAEQYTHEVDSSRFLHVRDQWIHCNMRPVLRLPEAACCNVNGDQLAIAFASGRVLSFTIDRQNTDLELG